MKNTLLSSTLLVAVFAVVADAQIRPDNPQDPQPRRPKPERPRPDEPKPRVPGPGENVPAEERVRLALEFQGGSRKLDAVKSFQSELSVIVSVEDGFVEVEVDETWSENRLRTRVKEQDRSEVETSWDGRFVYVRTDGSWEKLSREEAGKDYRDIRENLRRIDRLLHLFTPTAQFRLLGRKLVRIHVSGNTVRPFQFCRWDDPEARKRSPWEDESRLQILEVLEIERSDPGDPTAKPFRIYINDTPKTDSYGHVIGVLGTDLDGESKMNEVLWFSNFQPSKHDRSLVLPAEIQIYRVRDLAGRHEMHSLVKIFDFKPNVRIPNGFFTPVR